MENKKVGLAISGGWIRAAAAIGAIEVLQENGIKIDMISGCSAGSVVGSAYAVGSLDKLHQRLLRGKFKDYWQVIFEPTFPKNGFLKGKRILQFWQEFVGEKCFADLDKKLFLAALDLNSSKPVIINQGKIAQAINACVNVPGLFVAHNQENEILSDGGSYNLIPSKILYDNGADYVIAINIAKPPGLLTRLLAGLRRSLGRGKNFEREFKSFKRPNIIKLVLRSLRISNNQLFNFFPENYQYDILIRPDVEKVKRWKISKVDFLIKRGREAALKQLVQIKHDLGIWQ